ncbi:MAG: D-aminoacyl-tRNA deacylase [Pseudomonadota bacterium]
MIALLQRVSQARVDIDRQTVGQIDRGLAVLLGVQPEDTEVKADRLLQRLLAYRVFPDEQGRMNRSLTDISGGLLLVPQFTLAADTRQGNRPGFSTAAPPALGRELFDYVLAEAERCHSPVGAGRFGADMQVTLTNDGPVTFWLEV